MIDDGRAWQMVPEGDGWWMMMSDGAIRWRFGGKNRVNDAEDVQVKENVSKSFKMFRNTHPITSGDSRGV